MYPEFIAIYVGLGVVAALLIAAIVLLLMVLSKLKNLGGSQRSYTPPRNTNPGYSSAMGVVFCDHCGTQFDGATKVCPRCGTPR